MSPERSLSALLVAVGLAATGPVVAGSEPIAAWSLDEGAGPTAVDVSGNGHDGTLENGAGRDPDGYFGAALLLDGVAGNVGLGGLDVPGSQLTIALWFRARDFEVPDARLISKAAGVEEQAHYWMLSTIDARHPRFRLRTIDPQAGEATTTTLVATSAVLSADVWTHLAATYDGTRMRLYVNGVAAANRPKQGPVATSPAVPAWIGDNPGGGRAFDGWIDEVQIFDRALGTGEIATLMSTPLGDPGPDDEPPSAPTGLAAAPASSTRIDLTWNASSDNIAVADYGVFRDGVEIGTTESAAFGDSTASPSTTYEYFVTARDLAGNASDPSETVMATTPTPDVVPPTAPPWLVAQPVSGTSIDLAWGAAADDRGVVAYDVRRDGSEIATTAATTWTDAALEPATEYRYVVTARDADGNVSAPSPEATAETPDDPDAGLLDVWHGSYQQFGAPGKAQRWVNVPGRVTDLDAVTGLEFSLNGGAFAPLGLGPDTRRLYFPGDFNVEIAFADLLPGDNTVLLRAAKTGGGSVERTVTVHYVASAEWPADYTVDWGTVANVQDVVQVIDGQWSIEPGGLVADPPAYDRLVAFGEQTRDSFEAVVPFTVRGIEPPGPVSSEPAFGLILGWTGHTDDPVFCPQPHCGWRPNGNSAWYWWSETGGRPGLIGGTLYDPTGTTLDFFVSYVLKIRVESAADSGIDGGLYKYKIWPAAEDEPLDWTATGIGDPAAAAGSVLIVAHHVDAVIGNLRLQALPDVTAPAAPAGLLATPSSAFGVELSWSAAQDDFLVTEYSVYRDGEPVGTTEGRSFSDAPLAPLTSYGYAVTALDEAGNESAPVLATARTPPAPAGPVCGNERVDAGEQCDDGNTDDGDGCSFLCRLEFTASNAVRNGDFTDGARDWRFYSDGDATFRVLGGEAVVDVVTAGDNVQLYQTGVTLTPGARYVLSFVARSLLADDFALTVQQHASPNANYGLQNKRFDLTPLARAFSVEFVATADANDEARLMFWLAPFDREGGQYVVDDVALVRVPSACGNGVVEEGEVCDDGDLDNTDACLNDCAPARCGDGWVEAGVEECDDGNAAGGVGCSMTCRIVSPGRGRIWNRPPREGAGSERGAELARPE